VQSEVPECGTTKDRVIARLLFQGARRCATSCFGNGDRLMADRPRVSKSFARYSEGAPTMPRRCQDCTMFRKLTAAHSSGAPSRQPAPCRFWEKR